MKRRTYVVNENVVSRSIDGRETLSRAELVPAGVTRRQAEYFRDDVRMP